MISGMGNRDFWVGRIRIGTFGLKITLIQKTQIIHVCMKKYSTKHCKKMQYGHRIIGILRC